MSIDGLTALQLGKKIREREIKAAEAVEAVFQRIAEREERLHCYITLNREAALKNAEIIQQRLDRGEAMSPLAGVPFAVKDNICTKGIRTTCASRMLENFYPTYNATAVDRLEQAGCIIIGKTNMDEFAMGSTTETSAFGITRNPRDERYVPGGSSGGSGAAVASGECFGALGSDTGGSIRQPAAFCGVVGMKPTYGTVSRYGLIAYGSSLDQIGPVSRDVRDCGAILEVLAFRDKKDATSISRGNVNFTEGLDGRLEGMRIGIPGEYLVNGLDKEIADELWSCARILEERGALVEECHLPLTEYAIPAYYTIACAEASSNLERYDGVKYGYRAPEYDGLHGMYKRTRSEGFGAEAKRRILLGTFVLSSGYYDAYFMKALKTKAMIKKTFDNIFARYDMLLFPTAPSCAPRLGESLQDPIKMYLGDVYTISANLAGLPAISVPAGLSRKGLPIGIQLMGNMFQEKMLLNAALAVEQEKGLIK